jgi:hypothetical protein
MTAMTAAAILVGLMWLMYNLDGLRDQHWKSEEWKRDMMLLQQQTLEEQNRLLELLLAESKWQSRPRSSGAINIGNRRNGNGI